MMYTQFLCAALILSNSFFTLQARAITYDQYNDFFKPSPPISRKDYSYRQPATKVIAKVDVKAKVIARTALISEYSINEDGETPGAYFDRLEAENEKNRVFYTAGLLLLAQDKTISAKYKAEIDALIKKENWVEQCYKLEELEFRKKSILQTQGVFTEILPQINPEYIPTSIFVPQHSYTSKDIGSSLLLPLQTVEIRDCDYKIIDQLSTTHRSFFSWLFTQRKPITVFFVPAQTKKQTAERKPIYVQCIDTLSAQFDTKGELGIAGASFQNCHEITDSKTIGDLHKNPHETPGMLYMSAADGGAYVILGGMGGLSTFVPVLMPVAMVGATGYVCWEIFKDTEKGKAFIAAWKDRSEKKAAKNAKEAKAKEERKTQEAKLKAEKNKNSSGGDPKKPDDEEIKKKIEQAHIDPKDLLHNNKTENYEIVIPDKKSIEKHIFRNEPGHLLDTPENRKLIVDVASDDKNFLVTDDFKLNWFAKTLENGKQVWVRTKSDGSVVNAGINDVPKIADPNRGLCNNIMKSE